VLRVHRLVSVVVPFWLLACANPQTSSQPLVNSDVISEEEIAATNASNAYEVIKRLRGNFLSFRGKTSLLGTSNADPTVYVDDQAYGPISSLKTIPATQITSIRMYRSWEATTKYGQGNMGGVIAIATKQ
jgi:outer membrane cobalamin receptor